MQVRSAGQRWWSGEAPLPPGSLPAGHGHGHGPVERNRGRGQNRAAVARQEEDDEEQGRGRGRVQDDDVHRSRLRRHEAGCAGHLEARVSGRVSGEELRAG